MPHRGIEAASAACRSDALPTELRLHPNLNVGWNHSGCDDGVRYGVLLFGTSLSFFSVFSRHRRIIYMIKTAVLCASYAKIHYVGWPVLTFYSRVCRTKTPLRAFCKVAQSLCLKFCINNNHYFLTLFGRLPISLAECYPFADGRHI